MRRVMTGEMVVNDDRFGASSVRFRLYFSGMGIAAALDRLEVAWHDKIFEPKATLAGLLATELGMTGEQLDAEVKALGRVRGSPPSLRENRTRNRGSEAHRGNSAWI